MYTMLYMHKTVPWKYQGIVACCMIDCGRTNNKTWHEKEGSPMPALAAAKHWEGMPSLWSVAILIRP